MSGMSIKYILHAPLLPLPTFSGRKGVMKSCLQPADMRWLLLWSQITNHQLAKASTSASLARYTTGLLPSSKETRTRETLPLPPIMDSKVIEAKERYRTTKKIPDKENLTEFQKKLYANAHGKYLAMSMRAIILTAI